MRLAMRPEYAVDVAGVVSATTATFARLESSSTTFRPKTSFTSTRPPGSARTLAIFDQLSALVEVTGPSCRIGGCCCAAAPVEARRSRSECRVMDRGTWDNSCEQTLIDETTTCTLS